MQGLGGRRNHQRTLESALKVKEGMAAQEQDSVAKATISYSPTILAFLLLTASRSPGSLEIVDFGGGLGSNYSQNRRVLQRMAETTIRWHVVERRVFAELGTEYFQNDELQFYSSFDELLARVGSFPRALIFTGSLQYTADPEAILRRALELGVDLFAFERLLVGPNDEPSIFIQHPPPSFYDASYPVRCFSRDKFIRWFEAKGFSLVDHFNFQPNATFDHCGMIFVHHKPQ